MTETLTQQLLRALQQRGATEVFGIPGDFALPMFGEIERCGLLPLRTLSHEPAVGFAADAAARARGGLGVAAVTYGAGAFNLVNAVAGAYAERVPLVVLSGAPAAHEAASGLLLHHQVKSLDSQWRLFEEVTVDRARLDDATRAPELIARVLDAALHHARPVYLEIPRDMATRPCGPVPAVQEPVVDRDRLAACADEMLAQLRRAETPVLMVGVEVRRFGLEAQVAELALRLQIPVVTTFMGRGLLAGTASPPIGTYLGLAGDEQISELVESSDGLLLLGVIVSDTNFAVSARRIDVRHAIHVFDGDVTLGHHAYHGIALSELIGALLSRLPARAAPSASAPAQAKPLPVPAQGPLVPQDISNAIAALMQSRGSMPLASDMGDCLFATFDLPPTALIAPGYYATMGYGVPAGLGLQVATGERPIILVGDGAFQMTGWELGNARRLGCDPIVLVFNNAGWEMLRTFTPGCRFNDMDRWDFASMAAGMGGDGHHVETREQLNQALEQAHATRGRFQLLDIRLAPGALSPTLARFVAAVKRLSMPS